MSELWHSLSFSLHDQQDSQWREKALQKYQAKQQQNGWILFSYSSFFLSSDGLVLCCVNLSCWFTHKTATNYTEHFEVSQDACNHPLDNYGFVQWDAIFICRCAHAQKWSTVLNWRCANCLSSWVLFSDSVPLSVAVFCVVRTVPSYFAGELPWSLCRTISCVWAVKLLWLCYIKPLLIRTQILYYPIHFYLSSWLNCCTSIQPLLLR